MTTTDALLTDGTAAARFAVEHRNEARFCHPWNKWIIWNGDRWTLDERGHVYQLAKTTVMRMLAEASVETNDGRRAELLKWVRRTDSRQGREAMIALARSEPGIPVAPDEFDRDPWLLNTASGTVELKTGTLREHRREDMLMKLTRVTYDPEATAPRWQRFLEEMLLDPVLRRFVQAAVGYSTTGDVTEQCFFFLLGSGRNGKSVFLATVQAALGDYSIQAMPDLLMAHQNETHPTALTDLCGRRFVCTVESDEGRRFNESLVKWLTGGDAIRARRMHEDLWQFSPTHKIWLAANSKPVIRGNDLGIWRRVRLIPFTVVVPEEKCDPRLGEALLQELPGVLRWAIEGALLWQREGLRTPAVVTAATSLYRSEMDVVGRFITDACFVGPFAQVAAADIYKAFLSWCSDNREREMSQQLFGRRLTDHGFTNEPRRGRSWWLGVGLLTRPSDPDPTGERAPTDEDEGFPQRGEA